MTNSYPAITVLRKFIFPIPETWSPPQLNGIIPVSWATPTPIRLHTNPSITFQIILLTKTNKQTNKQGWIHNLRPTSLGGGKNINLTMDWKFQWHWWNCIDKVTCQGDWYFTVNDLSAWRPNGTDNGSFLVWSNSECSFCPHIWSIWMDIVHRVLYDGR